MEGIVENAGAIDVTTDRHVAPLQSLQDGHRLYLVAFHPKSATYQALFATIRGLLVTKNG
jgi:hypothetical protein